MVLEYSEGGGERMLYEDKWGRVWLPDLVDEMPVWQIEDLGIHVLEELEKAEL